MTDRDWEQRISVETEGNVDHQPIVELVATTALHIGAVLARYPSARIHSRITRDPLTDVVRIAFDMTVAGEDLCL